MGVAHARAAASDAIEAVEHGEDPGAAKKAAKAERIDAQLSERDTVRAMFDLYKKRRLTQLKAGYTVQQSSRSTSCRDGATAGYRISLDAT